MHLMRMIRRYVHETFSTSYGTISLNCFIIVLFVGYLDYELNVKKCDLNCWMRLMKNVHDMPTILMLSIVAFKVTIIVFMFLISLRIETGTLRMAPAQLKRRYRKFIVMRLVADLDLVQTQFGRRRNSQHKTFRIADYVQKHERISSVIRRFRSDALKLFERSDTELSLPLEDVLYVDPQLERQLKSQGYGKFNAHITDELILSMLRSQI